MTTFSRRKICRYARHVEADIRKPIRRSNCALAWSGTYSRYGVPSRKDRHRECVARIGIVRIPFAAGDGRELGNDCQAECRLEEHTIYRAQRRKAWSHSQMPVK